MKAEVFEQHKKAVISTKTVKPIELTKETGKLWNEIHLHRYMLLSDD